MTPFDWKFLQIGTLRAKDLRKNLSKLQKGGLTPVPLTLLVIRVVLLLWSYGSYKGFCIKLYIAQTIRNDKCFQILKNELFIQKFEKKHKLAIHTFIHIAKDYSIENVGQ